jgi:UDP-N-acetylmuramoyl-L-alanyl-D-glutamate--2,6-diaminopimelate ligase
MEATDMVRATSAGIVRLSSVLPDARRIGNTDVPLSSCCSDAARVQPGDIFVALESAAADGHFQAQQAVDCGAAAIVAERLLPVSIPQYLVEDTREAYGRLCQQVVGQPSRRMCTIGVTGTHGKTTIATLIAAIFEAAGETVGWCSSLGWSHGSEPIACGNSSYQPPQLARRLADMNANGCSAAVLEVSSRALAERTLSGIDLDVAVLSNVRRGALDLHGNLENYRRAKLRLLDHLKSPGLVVINADDPYLSTQLNNFSGPVLSTGFAETNDVSATLLERATSEQTFLLTMGCETVPVRTRIIGDHYVSHCLQAAAVGLSLGIDLARVVRGIESIERLPGRMERIECGQPFSVFVDGAQSPDRLEQVLQTLRSVTRGRVITVFGPHGNAPRDYRPLIGRVVERGAHVGILTSNSPGTQPPLSIAHDVIDGYARAARAHFIADRRTAIHWALSQAHPGDSVLIAGKGDMQGQDLGDRVIPFDDRDVVRNWCYDDDREAPAVTNNEPVILRMY